MCREFLEKFFQRKIMCCSIRVDGPPSVAVELENMLLAPKRLVRDILKIKEGAYRAGELRKFAEIIRMSQEDEFDLWLAEMFVSAADAGCVFWVVEG